jgi:hypothetical protein
MAGYDLREGDTTAAGAWGKLTKVGPETRDTVTVPNWAHSIKEITGVAHFDAADQTGGIVALRLSGLKWGNYETLLVGWTAGTAVGNAGEAKCMKPLTIKTNLAVTPGSDLVIESALIGTTSTINSTNVELAFDASEGEKRYGFVRGIQVAAPGTKTAANSDVISATAYGIKIPSDAVRISSLMATQGGVMLATASGGIGLFYLSGGLPDGDFSIMAGGASRLATTAGLDSGYFRSDQLQCDVKVSPGSTITCWAETVGTDWGTVEVFGAIEMAVR